MLLSRSILAVLAVLTAAPAGAQRFKPMDSSPDQLKRYNDCMALARSEPLKALPMAEKWRAEGGGFGARHCAALAVFEAGRYGDAAVQFESIARDMHQDRPGVRAELWAQAGQAFLEAGLAERAAEAQSRALELKANDPDLWIDRGLSYAAMKAWPRAISDFDRALTLRPDDLDILVLRAAAWRSAGRTDRALDDVARALRIAPNHPEALLERGFVSLARGDRRQANDDFNTVLRLALPGSSAARRAQAGLGGEQPLPAGPGAKR